MLEPTQDRPCKKAWALRSAWYDSLADVDRLAYQEHLRTCAQCRLKIARARKLVENQVYDDSIFDERENDND